MRRVGHFIGTPAHPHPSPISPLTPMHSNEELDILLIKLIMSCTCTFSHTSSLFPSLFMHHAHPAPHSQLFASQLTLLPTLPCSLSLFTHFFLPYSDPFSSLLSAHTFLTLPHVSNLVPSLCVFSPSFPCLLSPSLLTLHLSLPPVLHLCMYPASIYSSFHRLPLPLLPLSSSCRPLCLSRNSHVAPHSRRKPFRGAFTCDAGGQVVVGDKQVVPRSSTVLPVAPNVS